MSVFNAWVAELAAKTMPLMFELVMKELHALNCSIVKPFHLAILIEHAPNRQTQFHVFRTCHRQTRWKFFLDNETTWILEKTFTKVHLRPPCRPCFHLKHHLLSSAPMETATTPLLHVFQLIGNAGNYSGANTDVSLTTRESEQPILGDTHLLFVDAPLLPSFLNTHIALLDQLKTINLHHVFGILNGKSRWNSCWHAPLHYPGTLWTHLERCTIQMPTGSRSHLKIVLRGPRLGVLVNSCHVLKQKMCNCTFFCSSRDWLTLSQTIFSDLAADIYQIVNSRRRPLLWQHTNTSHRKILCVSLLHHGFSRCSWYHKGADHSIASLAGCVVCSSFPYICSLHSYWSWVYIVRYSHNSAISKFFLVSQRITYKPTTVPGARLAFCSISSFLYFCLFCFASANQFFTISTSRRRYGASFRQNRCVSTSFGILQWSMTCSPFCKVFGWLRLPIYMYARFVWSHVHPIMSGAMKWDTKALENPVRCRASLRGNVAL